MNLLASDQTQTRKQPANHHTEGHCCAESLTPLLQTVVCIKLGSIKSMINLLVFDPNQHLPDNMKSNPGMIHEDIFVGMDEMGRKACFNAADVKGSHSHLPGMELSGSMVRYEVKWSQSNPNQASWAVGKCYLIAVNNMFHESVMNENLPMRWSSDRLDLFNQPHMLHSSAEILLNQGHSLPYRTSSLNNFNTQEEVWWGPVLEQIHFAKCQRLTDCPGKGVSSLLKDVFLKSASNLERITVGQVIVSHCFSARLQ